MRKLKLLILAVFAVLSLGAVATTAAMGEAAEVLVLEGTVQELHFLGEEAAKSTLSTLAGKTIEGTGVKGSLLECLPLTGNEKDTNLCHKGEIDFTGVKKEKVACRSETAAGVKDPIETVLVFVDVHLADEETAGGVLEPILIFKVKGQEEKETELIINCGGVKEKVKGEVACLVEPALTEILAGANITVLCKAASAGDQETGKCKETKELCELLEKEPLMANLGNGFEMAAMAAHLLKLTANRNIFIDD